MNVLTKKQIDRSLLRVEEGLNKYIALQNDFRKVDVSTDLTYQRRFNHFYRVRRNADWRYHFYKLLQVNKSIDITFKDALKAMHTNTGRMEASYVSKLVATINPGMAVIDKHVLENVGLKLPYAAARDREYRICSVYEELQNIIKEFLKTENGIYLVKKFKAAFPEARITDIKMVDLVLWQTR